jgi:hypothetical protein
MSNKIIGQTMEGRQYKTDGSNSNAKPLTITAPTGDGATANSATEFLKLVGSDGAGTTGAFNITRSDPTGGGALPAGTEKGLMVSVEISAGTVKDYWLAIYPVV